MILIGGILLAIFVVPAPWNIPVVIAAGVIEIAETGFWFWYTHRRRAQMGPETLIGATAQVVAPCAPVGQVRVQGELWRARCEAGAAAGETVRVVELDGLTLVVEPAS